MDANKNVTIIFDYDDTITEECCEHPIFEDNLERIQKKYTDIDIKKASDYWKVVDTYYKGYDREIAYIQCMLKDISEGVFMRNGHKLTDDDMRYYGSLIKLSPGIIEFINNIKMTWCGKVNLSIYVISVGIRNIIMGSEISSLVDGIYASELVSTNNCEYLNEIKTLITSFSKTATFIKLSKGIDNINLKIVHNDHKFPYKNSIIIGDGLSDSPLFGYAGKKGAKIIGVYKKGSMEAYNNAHCKIGIYIDALLPRDYTPSYVTYKMINKYIDEISSNNRCTFPHQLIHLEHFGKLEHDDVIDMVNTHYNKCIQCSPIVKTYQYMPK
jgi:hypothetical protein